MEPSAVYDMVRIRGTLSFESFGFFGFLRFQYYCCSSLSENTLGFMIHEYTCTFITRYGKSCFVYNIY